MKKKKKALLIAGAALVLLGLILGLGPDLLIAASERSRIVSPAEAVHGATGFLQPGRLHSGAGGGAAARRQPQSHAL